MGVFDFFIFLCLNFDKAKFINLRLPGVVKSGHYLAKLRKARDRQMKNATATVIGVVSNVWFEHMLATINYDSNLKHLFQI